MLKMLISIVRAFEFFYNPNNVLPHCSPRSQMTHFIRMQWIPFGGGRGCIQTYSPQCLLHICVGCENQILPTSFPNRHQRYFLSKLLDRCVTKNIFYVQT